LFLPVSFIDTSDMWLERRRRRALVAIAGPYVNVVLAGIACCLLPFVGHGHLAAASIAFATTGYAIGAFNLNPLYELDGYYVLSDLLGIPNLRAKALSYLGTTIWQRASDVSSRAQRRIFAGYGIAAVGYALFAAVAILFGYHRLVEHLAERALPHSVTAVLGWSLAGILAALLLLNLWHGLRDGLSASETTHVR
jgi:putative peptide zinc metalloprotease protein